MTTKEAQSEASSVVDELEKLIPRCKTKDIHDFPDLKDGERCYNCELWDAIDAKINRLIVDKQLEILKGLKKMCKRRDTAMGDNTFVACVFESEIEQQIDELSNNLSKGDV